MRTNRIVYMGIFLAALIFVYFYGGVVPYRLFYIVLILPVISLIYTIVIYFRFKYTQSIDHRFITKGEKVNFFFSVNNEDIFLYPFVTVSFCGADTIFAEQFQKVSFSIWPRDKKTYSFVLECKYRGSYEMGIQSIEFEDLLGIFKLPYRIAETKNVTVYPRIIHLNKFRLSTNFLSDTHTMLTQQYEDMSTVSDIRNYAYGDSMKKIHWKLSSKTNELLVKSFQSTSETSAMLILDLKRNSFSVEQNTILEDKVIECTIAVLYYCLSHWIPVNLVFYRDQFMNLQGKSPADFEELFQILAKITFTGTVGIKDILDVHLSRGTGKTNMILFTSNIGYDLYDEIYKVKVSGYEIILIYVSAQELTGTVPQETQDVLANLPEIGVTAYKVNIGDDIKAILER